MKTIKHLTEKQLLSYADGSLKKKNAQIVGNHLLPCVDCRAALPVPTAQSFLAILTGDNTELIEAEDNEKDFKPFSFALAFSKITAFVERPLTIAWSSGAIVLILSISFLTWINLTTSNQAGREVAKHFEPKKVENLFDLKSSGQNDKFIPKNAENNGKPKPSEKKGDKGISNKVKYKSPKVRKKIKGQQRNLRKLTQKTDSTQKTNNNISSTRGGDQTKSKCDETESGVSLESKGGKVVLRWKKFPNAAKYNLYISDDEEILVDEYETQTNTSYVLEKSLDPTKNYRWKILVTLENGETIIGTSKKFNVKDFQMNEEDSKNKGKSAVRCSEKKEAKK